MNNTEAVNPIETPSPVVASKADTLTAQQKAIDAASVGSIVFHTAATYLAANTNAASVALEKAQATYRPAVKW